jgi:hypothetical protein
MLRKLTALALPLLFLTLACSATTIFSLTPTPTNYVYPTPETPTVPALTVEQLKNAEYVVSAFGTGASLPYKLTDGKYENGSGSTFVSLTLLDFFSFGDLNKDGLSDAAVLFAENYGGTGVFVSLAVVLNENGQPRHKASYLIDDRPQVNSLDLRDGTVFLDTVVHAPNDPGCCPEMQVTRAFQLVGDSITLVHATTRLDDGRERAILIESPLDGAEVSGQIVLTGTVTISPFENTLTVRVYNEQGNELFVGPVTVAAPELGAAGTFTVTIDASAFPLGRVRIVVADLSAADGSILALDSVEILVR